MKKFNEFNINFVGNIKKYVIASLAIILAGVIAFAIMGVELDINFKGGSRFTYTYEGEIDLEKVEKVADKTLGKNTSVSGSDSAVEAGSSKIIISVADIVNADDVNVEKDKDDEKGNGAHQLLEKALQKEFSKNKIAFAESNVVEASIARGFYSKSLIAILLSAVLSVGSHRLCRK